MSIITIIDRLNAASPFAYKVHHSALSLLMMAAVSGLLWLLGTPILPALVGGACTGSAFYGSREYAQAELKGYWDHPGWAWPCGVCWTVVAAYGGFLAIR